jgi:hypothetical protein
MITDILIFLIFGFYPVTENVTFSLIAVTEIEAQVCISYDITY